MMLKSNVILVTVKKQQCTRQTFVTGEEKKKQSYICIGKLIFILLENKKDHDKQNLKNNYTSYF